MNIVIYTLFGTLFLGAVVSGIRFRVLDANERIIAILLLITFPQVLACYILSRYNQNNLYIIQSYSLIEFLLYMVYYYRLLSNGMFRIIPFVLAALGLAWFAAPFFSSKPVYSSLSFILVEAISIIVVSALYCVQVLIRTDYNIIKIPSFWITIAVLFYWTTTYTRYGLLLFYNRVSAYFLEYLEAFFIAINIGFYIAIAIVLFNYKRLKPACE